MRRFLTPRRGLELVGLAHLLYLYGYGLLHWRAGTAALALAWIALTLHFWREERP